MKKKISSPYVRGMLAGFGAISLSVAFFFLLYGMQGIGEALDTLTDILAPFLYGGVIAYLLRPMCNFYETLLVKILPRKIRKLAEGLAVALSLITGILLVYMLIILVAPEVYESLRSLWNTLPEKADQLLEWGMKTFGDDEELLYVLDQAYDKVYLELDNWAKGTLVPYVTNIVSGVGSSVWAVLIFLKNILIGLVVAMYLLASRKKFARQGVMVIRSVLKPKWADRLLDELAFVDKMFGGFIDGKFLDSAIIGLLCYIGCVIFRFPNALLVSAIVGITNVIPFFGPFIGGIPSVLLIMIENPIKGLWFALFVLGLQQLDGNVIGPKILGDKTGLSSFWVLFSIVLCGGLWGIVGMVICVPLFAVIFDLLRKLVHRGLKRNGRMDLWEEYEKNYGTEPEHPKTE
jgi:predicted PurR-regulated permease PerM